MERWKLDLKHEGLKDLHDSFLFSVENVLTYYLACTAFDQHTVFVVNDPASMELRASDDFPDGYTSKRSLQDIDNLRKTGEFANLVRSHCIFSLITAFVDFFEDVRSLLNIPPEVVKPHRQVKLYNGTIYKVRPGSLKIAHYINDEYGLLGHMTDIHTTTYIDNFISLRHMYVHNRGRFSEDYRDFVVNRWKKLKAGDRIVFGPNDFDDVLHFLVMNISGFVLSLDKKLNELVP